MRVKKTIWAGVLLLGLIFSACTGSEASGEAWNNIEKSKHYIIYYQDAPAKYIRRLVREAERCYRDITGYLGFVRFDFWVWDNRCKIFLYPDAETYRSSTGALSWSRGHVRISTKEISTYIGQEMFFDTILPHEIGHIVFR
ncbi:MAG: hypothetical protein PHV40_05065, partial [Candidatus Omnitrophica bacterium]|nr:hypothetical protein [Candidatus Omnitrophota bacterium]